MRTYDTSRSRAARSTPGFVLVPVLGWLAMACADDASQAQLGERAPLLCTAIGCADGAMVSLKRAGDTWPPGSYRIAVTFDSDRYNCSFDAPEDLPKTISDDIRVSCDPHSIAHFAVQQDCRTRHVGDSDEADCQFIPERCSIALTVQEETPKMIEVQVERDGEPIFRQRQDLEYSMFTPNGPRCAPVCTRAELELQIP